MAAFLVALAFAQDFANERIFNCEYRDVCVEDSQHLCVWTNYYCASYRGIPGISMSWIAQIFTALGFMFFLSLAMCFGCCFFLCGRYCCDCCGGKTPTPGCCFPDNEHPISQYNQTPVYLTRGSMIVTTLLIFIFMLTAIIGSSQFSSKIRGSFDTTHDVLNNVALQINNISTNILAIPIPSSSNSSQSNDIRVNVNDARNKINDALINIGNSVDEYRSIGPVNQVVVTRNVIVILLVVFALILALCGSGTAGLGVRGSAPCCALVLIAIVGGVIWVIAFIHYPMKLVVDGVCVEVQMLYVGNRDTPLQYACSQLRDVARDLDPNSGSILNSIRSAGCDAFTNNVCSQAGTCMVCPSGGVCTAYSASQCNAAPGVQYLLSLVTDLRVLGQTLQMCAAGPPCSADQQRAASDGIAWAGAVNAMLQIIQWVFGRLQSCAMLRDVIQPVDLWCRGARTSTRAMVVGLLGVAVATIIAMVILAVGIKRFSQRGPEVVPEDGDDEHFDRRNVEMMPPGHGATTGHGMSDYPQSQPYPQAHPSANGQYEGNDKQVRMVESTMRRASHDDTHVQKPSSSSHQIGTPVMALE